MSIVNRMAVGAKSAHNALYRRFDTPFLRNIKGMPILLLTVAGRTSGKPYTTPVVYFTDGEDYVVSGSAGGAAEEPQWFRNLRRAATATVEVGDKRFDVRVRVAEGEEYDRLWARLLEVGPFFAGYRAKAGREMPIAVLSPTDRARRTEPDELSPMG